MNKKLSIFFICLGIILIFNKIGYAQYCLPTYSQYCQSATSTDYINNFSTTGGITNITNNGSGCNGSTPNNYIYNSGMNVSQVQGLSFNISVQAGPTFQQGFGIYIDFNNNNSFADPGEFVWNSVTASLTPFTGSITIPMATSPGVKRMRVRAIFAAAPAAGDFCGSATYGETEDYNLTVIAAVPCTASGLAPVPGTAVPNILNPCPGVPVSVNLVGAAFTSGLNYTWLQSTTGTAPWVPIPPPVGSSPTLVVTPPAGGTFCYRCIVNCTGNGLFDTSAMGCIVVQPYSCNTACYGISEATSATDQDILNVTVGSINNTTDCINPLTGSQGPATGTASRYANFNPGIAPATVYKGLATPFSITLGTCGFGTNGSVKIYIDFNQNASFLDPGEEVYFNPSVGTVSPSIVLSGTFTTPLSAVNGCTKMRVIFRDQFSGTIVPVGTYNIGETEDYSINIIQPSPTDPAITAINVPTGNCFTSNETVVATLCNYGSAAIDLTANPVTATLNVTGVSGVTSYTVAATSGILNPYGTSCVNLTFNNVDLYPGGAYAINTSLTITGVANGNLINDSLANPVNRLNYRPTGGPDFHVCQGDIIPFGQGLTVTGCATPIQDSVTMTFVVASSTTVPCLPSGTTYTGACLVATTNWPILPPGTTFGSGVLKATNLATANGGFALETRMPLFSGTTPVTSSNILYPSIIGNTAVISANYTWQNTLTGTQISNMYNPGAVVNIGYHSTWAGNATSNGMTINASGQPTVITLKFNYTYVPASFEWYSVPVGGSVLYNFSPFNPVGVAGSGITNTNTPSTTPFFASCTGSSDCRVQVNLVVDPVPNVLQDTILACEYAIGSYAAAFDLTTISGTVSNFDPTTTVDYYGDPALWLQVPNYSNDTNSTNFIYSKVSYANGCYASDSIYLDVKPIPQFSLPVYLGSGCAPYSLDISSLINVFPTTGNDTLFFNDPFYSMPYTLDPHNITLATDLYMIVKSNTGLACADSSLAVINIQPATNFIANQDTTFFFSNCVTTPFCNNINIADGATETLFTTADCRKVATVTDKPNSISLGQTEICEGITCGVQTHNGQPYVNRFYEITPNTNDSATVCLYYTQQDFNDFNDYALINGLDQINPTTNLCITQVDGGPLGSPGSTSISIPNSSMTSTFDPLTQVWTVCFPVDSFSTFYCHACNPLNAPLPVSLTNFSGKRDGNTSVLSWTTSAEINNHHFMVERSKDAKTFMPISGSIASKAPNGNSQTELKYGFTDNTPNLGHNYYRLQQVDIDGHSSNSHVVDVYFGEETIVSLYPNPANKVVYLDIQTPKATNAQAKIMDAAGRVVKTIAMQVQAGGSNHQIDISDLADGIYMLQVSNNKGLQYTQSFRKN
jgi:hypothetical protein